MIKSPKEKFQSNPLCKIHADIATSEAFGTACDYALLQMQTEMPHDPLLGHDSHTKMVGAQRIVQILKTIHEPQEETKPKVQRSLNYNEGV